MRFSRLRRLWFVVAAVSLLATPAFASGIVSFVCAGDLVARTACCCPEGHQAGALAAGPGASVSPACCCRLSNADVRETPAAAQPPYRPQSDARILLAPAATVTLGAVVPDTRAWPAERLAHPPPLAIPILLGKQSFLI